MNHKQERIKMISRNITIKNSVGLYARPATFFIQKANTFKSSIWIQKDDRRVNAKSLLGVLSLAISGGSTVTLIADGPDEIDAISGLELLVSTEI
jgi:phosphocarrier protein